MEEMININCEAYRRNPDHSWTCIKVTDIQTPEGSIRVNPGLTFRKNRPLWGIDVAKLLDDNCLK
jgi:hypothetical protein